MTQYFEAQKKRDNEFGILEQLYNGKKVNDVNENVLNNLKTALNFAKTLKKGKEDLKINDKMKEGLKTSDEMDKLGLSIPQRAYLYYLINENRQKEAENFVNSIIEYKKSSITGYVPTTCDDVMGEARKHSEIAYGKVKTVTFTPGTPKWTFTPAPPKQVISFNDNEVEKITGTVKKARLSKKELEDAKNIAKELAQKIRDGDVGAVEKLLPDLKKGEKWFGGARGIWVDKRIAILQALYNEMLETGEKKIKVDGIFGDQTFAAVKAMQEHFGLTGKSVDGYYDGETREAIIKWVRQQKTKAPHEVGLLDPTVGLEESIKQILGGNEKKEPKKKKEEENQETKEKISEEEKKNQGNTGDSPPPE